MKNSWLGLKRASLRARYAEVIDALVPLINHLEVSESQSRSYPKFRMVLEKKFIKSESKSCETDGRVNSGKCGGKELYS